MAGRVGSLARKHMGTLLDFNGPENARTISFQASTLARVCNQMYMRGRELCEASLTRHARHPRDFHGEIPETASTPLSLTIDPFK